MKADASSNQRPVAPPAREGLSAALEAFARLGEYPGADFEQRVQDARKALHGLSFRGRASAFERFGTIIFTLSPEAREELYTATFDVTPACVAYLSIHLFGEENFKRGEFMAALQARYRESGFDCRGELPDHISVLLRFTAIAGEEERRELVKFCLLGPLEKMIAALASTNPYRLLLETVIAVLRSGYPGMQPALSPLEQMQRHGGECPTTTSCCGCGSALLEDRTHSGLFPTAVTQAQRMVPTTSETNKSHG